MMASSQDTVKYKLRVGCPGEKHRAQAGEILKRATLALHEEGAASLDLAYGEQVGCDFYRQELAQFLSDAYEDPVESSHLLLTAGATHGFHFTASMLFKSGSPVFVVDPTYFIVIDVLRDLHMNMIPVPSDSQGIMVDEVERLFIAHRKDAVQEVTSRTPYWGMLYFGSVLANPNNVTLPPERCRQLVDLAKKHNVLLFSDDVYNLLYFNGTPPPRLLTYDNSPGDDYGNHVISNGSFSKLLSPGIRVGWIETGQKLFTLLSKSALLLSGGAVNHYGSQLVATALHHGWMQEQVKRVKQDLQLNMSDACTALTEHMPGDGWFMTPQGGYFIWIRLAEDLDGGKFMKWVQHTHGVSLLCGKWFSPSGSCQNYIRLSITNMEGDMLKEGIRKMCLAIEEFRTSVTDDLEIEPFNPANEC